MPPPVPREPSAAVAVLAPSAGPVLVAVSGGADSVFLLHHLLQELPSCRPQLQVVHFNHALRGAESDADEAFVRELAARLELPFHTERWDRVGEGRASEAECRRVRLAFLARTAQRLGATLVATGHHADDVAETVVLQMARGSGPTGLSTLRPVQVLTIEGQRLTFVRPLLHLRRVEIQERLRRAGHTWREDASNASAFYTRNRIRHEALPALEAALPEGFVEGALRVWRKQQEVADALDAILAQLSLDPTAPELKLAALAGAPRAVMRQALERWLTARGLSAHVSPEAVEMLLQAFEARKSTQLSAGPQSFIRLQEGILRVAEAALPPAWSPVGLAVPGLLVLPQGFTLQAQRVPMTPALYAELTAGAFSPSERVFLRADHLALPLQVRRWQPGDAYQPLGAPGRQKLQDLFTNAVIPGDERRRLPVVCADEGSILWVPGLPPAENVRVLPEAMVALTLTYLPV